MADLLVRWGMRDFKKLRGGGVSSNGDAFEMGVDTPSQTVFLVFIFLGKIRTLIFITPWHECYS